MGEAITSAVAVAVGGRRVGRRVAVAVAVGVSVEVGVKVDLAVAVEVGVAVAVAVGEGVKVVVNVAVGMFVERLAPGREGRSRCLSPFKRSLIMKPASKASKATIPIKAGTRQADRDGRTGAAIPIGGADPATTGTRAAEAITALSSDGATASKASSSSSALPYRSAGAIAMHFCTTVSS